MNISNKVTVIICVRNAEKTIGHTLETILKNKPKDIIIVDGNSSDNTLKICKEYKVRIFQDKGIGLGNARNIGLRSVNTEYVYYVGPDCILKENSITPLINNLEKNKWVGTQPLVSIYNPSNYFLKCINLYRKAKFYPGKRKIIGTPWLYKTSILKQYMFNEDMNYSDDTELCSRLEKDRLSIGITNVISYEIGESNILEIFNRWKMYGASDHDFYNLNKLSWGFKRKIISFLSPLNKDFILIIKSNKINFLEKIYILYFLIMILIFRYYGWYLAWSNKKKDDK
tara:strand:- start:1630 stop:2481 length:852 start_codon:yes stop_codon:yes gene_type:complete